MWWFAVVLVALPYIADWHGPFKSREDCDQIRVVVIEATKDLADSNGEPMVAVEPCLKFVGG